MDLLPKKVYAEITAIKRAIIIENKMYIIFFLYTFLS